MRFGSLLAILLTIAFPTAGQPALAADDVAPQPGEAIQQAIPFDGFWEGTIHFDKEAFLSDTGTPASGVKYRLELAGPVARVFLFEEGKFVEIKAGIFHIAPVETNAVIFASESSPGNWVESVVFVATQKDPNTLLVQLVRVVNNVGAPPDEKESKYATRGAGEFKRVAS